jgi:hypothetical protein
LEPTATTRVAEIITKTTIKFGFENASSFCFAEVGETRVELLEKMIDLYS